MIEHISDELDLTRNQVTSLKLLKDEMMNIKQQMHGDSVDHHAMIKEMILADQFDQAAMVEMINTKTEVIRQNSTNAVAALGNFVDGLNPDQKAELIEKMEKRRKFGRMHKRSHRHGDEHDRYEDRKDENDSREDG